MAKPERKFPKPVIKYDRSSDRWKLKLVKFSGNGFFFLSQSTWQGAFRLALHHDVRMHKMGALERVCRQMPGGEHGETGN